MVLDQQNDLQFLRFDERHVDIRVRCGSLYEASLSHCRAVGFRVLCGGLSGSKYMRFSHTSQMITADYKSILLLKEEEKQ